MSTVLVLVVVRVVAGGLTPALAGELEARRRAARELAWAAARAETKASQTAWARDRAQVTQDAARAVYMADPSGWGVASIRWEQARDAARASAQTAWDASQEADEAKTRAKEAQERATCRSIVVETLKSLKG